MTKKRVFIALTESEEVAAVCDFFKIFQYETFALESINNLSQINQSSDILIIDLYFCKDSVLQTKLLPLTFKYVIFLVTPRTLFNPEEEYALEGKMNILKKPIDFDVLYTRLLDQTDRQ